MKRLFFAVLAIFMVVTLTACAGMDMKKLTNLPIFNKTAVGDAETSVENAEIYVTNPGRPYIKALPGPEEIEKIAVKAFQYNKRKEPNACRLEIIIYGGNKEDIENREWFKNWFNNEQTIVDPAEVKSFFMNFDPNACTWDRDGNGCYKCWVKKAEIPTLDLGILPSAPAEPADENAAPTEQVE